MICRRFAIRSMVFTVILTVLVDRRFRPCKQGQKSVKTTQENIVKAKDKIADFKQKRAVKAAEQRTRETV